MRLSVLLTLLLGPVFLGAQQQPVFRSSTSVVPLTVTVLDKDGAPVKDLKQSDFTILENKSPREIINFFPQNFVAGPVPPDTGVPATRDPNSIVPHTRRRYLIVLGFGRIEHPTNALEGAIELVRKRLLPQDSVAVMGFDRTTDFTTDHEQIAQMLERYRRDHEKLVADINQYMFMSRPPPGSGTGGKPIPPELLKRAEEIFTGPPPAPAGALPPPRHTVDMLLAMGGAPKAVQVPRNLTSSTVANTLPEIEKDARDKGDELSDQVMRSTRLKMFAGIEYLRYLDGEKHMLFLANDAFATDADDAHIVAKRASDARVVVDLVSTKGTARRGTSGDPAGRVVADLTGGYYTSLETASKAVAKIDQAGRFSYLLGYAPVSATLDGKYRDVDVKVNRPGVTVRFAHGYFASAQPDPLVLKELIVKSRVELALSYDTVAKDIPLTVNATLLPRMGVRGEVRVEVRIGAAPLGLVLKDGLRSGQLELQIYCGDAKEQILCDQGERLDLSAGEALYDDWMKNGIRYVARVPVFENPKFIKVIVYDYGSDRIGSFMLTLK